MRIAIYTAIFDDYDTLQEPKKQPENVDFICFTDQNVKSEYWQIRQVQREFLDGARESRRYKILPHLFLPHHNYSIWHDGNFQMVGDATEQIADDPILMYDHISCRDKRNCIYDEATAILELGKISQKGYKDDPEIIQAQMERYRKEGFPPNQGLVSSGIIYRKHHISEVIELMNMWWDEILRGSKRDQLSFNYCAWKSNIKFRYIHQDVRANRYFQIKSHNA